MRIDDLEIEVIKKSIKNLHLSVLPPTGKIRISAPLNATDESINLFAITKIGWIKEKISQFNEQLRQSKREYLSGESHFLWGKRYRLEVILSNKNSIELKGIKMIFKHKKNMTIEQKEFFFNKWYRDKLKEQLLITISKWEAICNIKIEKFLIKNMLTRWGTCNSKSRSIIINLQLVKKPIECLEYIVLHELLHTIEKKHSKKFFELLEKYMPQWKVYKDELNNFILEEYEEINI